MSILHDVFGRICKCTDACGRALREQERIQKAEQARLETERILAEQQATVAAKKAEMIKRDAEKEKVGERCPTLAAAPKMLERRCAVTYIREAHFAIRPYQGLACHRATLSCKLHGAHGVGQLDGASILRRQQIEAGWDGVRRMPLVCGRR